MLNNFYLSTFEVNPLKHLSLSERLFGMSEDSLRVYLFSSYRYYMESCYDVFRNSSHYTYKKDKVTSYGIDRAVGDLYQHYKELKSAYFLYSKVKRKVDYYRVLLEEFISACIDVLKIDTDIHGNLISYISEYDYNISKMAGPDIPKENKARLYIRELFAEYLKRHVSKLCDLECSLFDEMKIKALIGSYYQVIKNNLENILIEADLPFYNEYNTILDEECQRAIDVYIGFFLNIKPQLNSDGVTGQVNVQNET